MGLDLSKVEELVGEESSKIAMRHKVNVSDVRHWAELIREDRRDYKTFAEEQKIVPPAMLTVWSNTPLFSWTPEGEHIKNQLEELSANLADQGFGLALTVSMNQKFHKQAYIGEQLHYRVSVLSVTEGETVYGDGVTVESVFTLENDQQETVCSIEYKTAHVKLMQIKR